MIRVILAATDGSDHAKKAVGIASELASKCGAKLVLLHTILRDARSDTLRKLAKRKDLSKAEREQLDNYEADAMVALAEVSAFEGGYMVVPPPPELLSAIGRQILDSAEAAARKAGVQTVSTQMIGGDPAEVILATAKRVKADVIVLGTRGLGEVKGFFLGSVSNKVSAHADCACMTVK
jgi:nucleotide-binding universal stress UspA family protein